MDASEVARLARATLEGSITFYAASGEAVVAPLLLSNLSPIAETLNSAELKAAIIDSQQHGQKFQAFCARAISAGVQGYFAFLRGKRVTYFGRQGDHHVEWFPGAQLGAAEQGSQS